MALKAEGMKKRKKDSKYAGKYENKNVYKGSKGVERKLIDMKDRK